MFDFYSNKFTSDINHFIKKAKDRVRVLDRDNQRFIEDIFTKGNYRSYGEILENNLINKFARRENVKFEDIFPENIHPALEILIGETNLKNFIKIGEKIKNTDISKERLIEVVIYAPQWKKIIDNFLMS